MFLRTFMFRAHALLAARPMKLIISMSISAHIYIHTHTSNPTSIHPNGKKGSVVYSAHILTHSIFTYTFTFISIYIYYDILWVIIIYYYIILYYIISIYLYSSHILFTLLRKVVSYISLTREPYVSSRFSVSLRVVISVCFISVLYLLWYNIWSLLVTNNYWIVLLVFI